MKEEILIHKTSMAIGGEKKKKAIGKSQLLEI